MTAIAAVAISLPIAGICSHWASAHDAILLRRKIMKAIGVATKEAHEMARGKRVFDPAKAKSHMELLSQSWPELEKLFPPGSDRGARTKAAGAVWTSFEDFKAKGREMAGFAKRAGGAAAAGKGAFASAFADLAVTCKGCHRTYMSRD